jgi:hypothetical protein
VDTNWIEPGEPPIISVHTPYDYTTPYYWGTVSPKNVGDVIDVFGSYYITKRCTELGIMDGLKLSRMDIPISFNLRSQKWPIPGIMDSSTLSYPGRYPDGYQPMGILGSL